jgi:hypothetical protein
MPRYCVSWLGLPVALLAVSAISFPLRNLLLTHALRGRIPTWPQCPA